MCDVIAKTTIAMWFTPDLVLQYLAIAGAFVAAVFAAWRFRIADKSLRQEQFLKAAELLAKETSGGMDPSEITRVSSVMTLGRLARSYPDEFHVVVMGMFAAYLGSPTVYRSFDREVAGSQAKALAVAPDADETREVIKFIEGRTEKQKRIECLEGYSFQLPMDAPFEMREDKKIYLTAEEARNVHRLLDTWNKSSPFLKSRHPELPGATWGHNSP